MKRRIGFIFLLTVVIFSLGAGAFSGAKEQTKENKQDEIITIEHKLTELTHRAHRLATEIREARQRIDQTQSQAKTQEATR